MSSIRIGVRLRRICLSLGCIILFKTVISILFLCSLCRVFRGAAGNPARSTELGMSNRL